MRKKTRVCVLSAILCLAFATASFAGILDAIVGGILGIPTQASQEQLENFHKSYMEKSAARVLETGDPALVFNEMVKEQRGIGCNVKVSEPDSIHKIAEISGGDLKVIVKCVLDMQDQTITISYMRPDGMPTGNVLTKKYDLPEGALKVSASISTNSDAANNSVEPQAFGGVSFGITNKEIEKKFSIMPNSETGRSERNGDAVEYVLNGITGCPAFDNSILKGNMKFIYHAFMTSQQGDKPDGFYLYTMRSLESECDRFAQKNNDPFMAPKLKEICRQLVAYYKATNRANIYVYRNADCIDSLQLTIDTNDGGGTYKLAKQEMHVPSPWDGCLVYPFSISSDQMHSIYQQLQNIVQSNAATLKQLQKNAQKKNFTRQKVTIVRISHGFDTAKSRTSVNFQDVAVMKNSYLSIRLIDAYVTYKDYKYRFDFTNSKWREVLGISQSDKVN